jgi:regulatory protein
MGSDCGTKTAMPPRTPRKPRPPLDEGKLDELALRYVGRFATTRSKLRDYLTRKLRERGWSGSGEADVAAIAERLGALGYVDDAAFALAKTRSLSGRGYGMRRVQQSLHMAGVGEDDRAGAEAVADAERVEAALRFARRRRIGPFAQEKPERAERERGIAAMIRAGHSFGLARAIVALDPGENFTLEELAEKR